MGEFKNHRVLNVFCIATALVLIGVNMYGLIPRKLLGFIYFRHQKRMDNHFGSCIVADLLRHYDHRPILSSQRTCITSR